MTPMRVRLIYFGQKPLLLSSTSPMSGTHRSAVTLARLLAEEGHSVVLAGNVASGEVSDSSKRVELHVCSATDLPLDHSVDVDIVVSGSERSFSDLKQVGLRGCVYWMQNPYRPQMVRPYLDYGLIKMMACVSRWHAKQYPRSYPIQVIDNIVGTNDLRCRPLVTSTAQRLVFVGAAVAGKGVDVLVRAWLSCERPPAATLAIVGGPDLYGQDPMRHEWYQREVATPAREDESIELLGSLDRDSLIAALVAGRVAIVNPKSYGSPETFCNAAAEAALVGRPLIGGAHGVLRELFVAMRSCIAVRSEADLARALEQTLTLSPDAVISAQRAIHADAHVRYDDERSLLGWRLLLMRCMNQ